MGDDEGLEDASLADSPGFLVTREVVDVTGLGGDSIESCDDDRDTSIEGGLVDRLGDVEWAEDGSGSWNGSEWCWDVGRREGEKVRIGQRAHDADVVHGGSFGEFVLEAGTENLVIFWFGKVQVRSRA